MMTFELDQISFLYSNEGTFLLGRVQVSLTFWEENFALKDRIIIAAIEEFILTKVFLGNFDSYFDEKVVKLDMIGR